MTKSKSKDNADLDLVGRIVLRREAMKFIKAHWGSFVAVAGTLMPFFIPSILEYIKHNPHTALGVLLSVALAAYYKSTQSDTDNIKALQAQVKTLQTPQGNTALGQAGFPGETK